VQGAVRHLRWSRLTAVYHWLDQTMEAERERLLLWMPVAFGAGALGYLQAISEPDLSLGLAVVGTCLAAASRRFFGLPGRFILALVGFAAMGQTYTQMIALQTATPVLTRPLNAVMVDARVIDIIPLERGGVRLILAPRAIEHWPGPISARIRVNLKHETLELAPGDQVRFRAGLMPPPFPIEPGGFDLARALWFQRIGAVGYVLGQVTRVPNADEANDSAGWIDTIRLGLAQWRHHVSARIQMQLPGAAGGVANALLTGVKGHIPQQTVEELRDAGLAHLLVVAGMHMGFVSAIIFLVVRGGLANFPRIALYYPIKKWAAAATLFFCFIYLLLTGAAAPTQRAFTMISIVMVAVMIDRRAVSMRLLALGAVVVMVLAPEAVISPGFQMSFAAVAALIAAYEANLQRYLPRLGTGFLSGAGEHVIAVALTTIIASLATEPFAAYHFDHIALYSIPANMIAVPITAVWNMPWGLLALLAMPFGLDGPAFYMMGLGISLVIEVAHFLTSLSYAIIHVPAMPPASLGLMGLGLTWICLWSQRWRMWGLVPIVLAFGLWTAQPKPDLLIDSDAKTIAIRTQDGDLKFMPGRPKTAPAESWLERDGVGRLAQIPQATRADRVACDNLGCIWSRPDGTRIAWARHPLARLEDCMRARIVISADTIDHCPSAGLVIDRMALAQMGAHTVRFTHQGLVVETAVPANSNRPWHEARRVKPAQSRGPTAGSKMVDQPAPTDEDEPIAPSQSDVPGQDSPDR